MILSVSVAPPPLDTPHEHISIATMQANSQKIFPKKLGRRPMGIPCIKTGGRQKGSPNKITAQTCSLIYDFVHRRIDSILQKEHEMDLMSPGEQMNLIKPLIPYVLTKPAEEDSPESSQKVVVFRQEIPDKSQD